MILNPEYKPYLEHEGALLLKHTQTGALISISAHELDILQVYVDVQDKSLLLIRLNDKYEIEDATIDKIIEKAEELSLLINHQQTINKKQVSPLFRSGIEKMLFVIFHYLGLYRKGFRIDMEGSYQFYRLFSVDFSETLLSKLFSRKLIGYVLFPAYITTTLFLINYAWHHFTPVAKLLSQTIYAVSFSYIYVILCLLVLLFISFLVHESGHFIIYKFLGGRESRLGIGLIALTIPVFYISTNDTYFWTNRAGKIWLACGGVLADIFTVLCAYSLALRYQGALPNISFLCSILAVLVALSGTLNLNFFLPSTDGYFIMSDLLRKENIFSSSYLYSKRIWQAVRARRLKVLLSFNAAHWLGLGYFLLSCIFITASWFLLFSVFLIPLFV